MIKLELVQPEYTAGNETVKAVHILTYLQQQGSDDDTHAYLTSLTYPSCNPYQPPQPQHTLSHPTPNTPSNIPFTFATTRL